MVVAMEPGELRAGDADRERVAERLRIALDEGRLNLYEYDDRLRDAYAAKTYAELDRLLADLPAPGSHLAVPPPDTVDRPGPDGRYPAATNRWLATMWNEWASAVGVCLLVWGGISLLSGEWMYFWPGWVAGPWGAVLVVQTVTGLASGEPQRWAAKQARKQAERELRRQAKRRDTSIEA
jgi:hypothetical protein